MAVRELSTPQRFTLLPQPVKVFRNKWEITWLKWRVFRQLFRIATAETGSPIAGLRLIRQVRAKYRRVFGEPMLEKVARVGERYFWRLGAAGFPSRASVRMHENEIHRFLPGQLPTGLRSLFIAITKQCPLNCEHCFEWGNLNQPEALSTAELIEIVLKYQAYGTTQIMLSGGEPMLRVNDIYKILAAAQPGTDFWIISSGLGLNRKRAQRLKQAGLTGVVISLDHFEAAKHDAFRGFPDAYRNAIEAVLNANRAGLVTTLSLCATREFTTPENLSAYLELAKYLGVSFVQLLEPRAKGRYRGKAVELGPEAIALLEELYTEYNHSPAYANYPIIDYPGYHQRRVGCFGGGNRFFYIDTDGDAHVCPFCEQKVAKVLEFSAPDIVGLLGQHGCHVFAGSEI